MSKSANSDARPHPTTLPLAAAADTARSGNRRSGMLSALRARIKTPYKTDSLWEMLRSPREGLHRCAAEWACGAKWRTHGPLVGRLRRDRRVEQSRLPPVFALISRPDRRGSTRRGVAWGRVAPPAVAWGSRTA